jgi:hypothetical protein
VCAHFFQARFTAPGLFDRVPGALQNQAVRQDDVRIVIYDKNCFLGHGRIPPMYERVRFVSIMARNA